MHSLLRAAGAAALVFSSHAAFAQDAPPAPTDAQPPPPVEAPAAPPPAAAIELPPAEPPEMDRPAPEHEHFRDSGFRLGLELGYARSFGGDELRENSFSPSLIPVGADISLRASEAFLIGIHGFYALASRDDCLSSDSCRARSYGVGIHFEGTPIRRHNVSAYIRGAVGYEWLYRGGLAADASANETRGAFDLLDLRVGADFVVHRGPDGKTARIGPYLGLVVGTLTSDSVSNGSGNADPLTMNAWFEVGFRGTLDP